MFTNTSFILASSSRSRYIILKNNGLNFKRISPVCNEDFLKKKMIKNKKNPKLISLELSRLKAKSVSDFKKNILVVGSDTVINLGGKLLSKAKNLVEAKKKILLMSGKTHYIYSSVSVFYNGFEVWHNTQKTSVSIRKLLKSDVDNYLLKSGTQILQSVGCYQLEKLGPNIIEKINGDFFNVMGFPLFPFLAFLEKKKKKEQVFL